MRRMFAMVVALALAAILHAQPAFRTSVDLVTVAVTVTAATGVASSASLEPADFRIYEDGVLRSCRSSATSRAPSASASCSIRARAWRRAARRWRFAPSTPARRARARRRGDAAVLCLESRGWRFPWTRGRDLKPVSWLEWRLSLGTALIDAMQGRHCG